MTRTAPMLAIAGLLATTTLANAADDDGRIPGAFSASIAFASDYVFRGISQTGSNPAVQGGIDWAHDSGVHLGVWGSNVDFGTDAGTEVDWVAGYAGQIGDVAYDLKLTYYSYPGASNSLDYDFWEAALVLGYDLGPASLGVAYNYSPAFFGGSGQAHYVSGSVAVAVPEFPLGLTLSAGIGRQFIEDNATWGTPDLTDWRVGAAGRVEGFDLALTYTDTDLASADCGGSNLCEGRFVFAVSRAF